MTLQGLFKKGKYGKRTRRVSNGISPIVCLWSSSCVGFTLHNRRKSKVMYVVQRFNRKVEYRRIEWVFVPFRVIFSFVEKVKKRRRR